MPSPLSRLARPPLVDVAFATGLTVFLLIVSPRIPNDEAQQAIDAGAFALIVLAAGSLAFRRVAPRATLAASTVAVSGFALADYNGGPVYLTPLIALFTIASLDGRRAAALPGLASVAVLFAAGLTQDRTYAAVLVHLLFLSWALAAILIGDAVRTRAQQMDALRVRARILEETREEEARRRVAEERVRIARDLHDVVAHSLASISIQAGMGAHVIDHQPDEARAALVAIRQASREALDELRATLAVLRDGDAAPTSPTAGLAALSTLTAAAEQAGLHVTVTVTGLDEHRVPAALDVTAYRIVQESLTNVMRHARADRVEVGVTVTDKSLEIDVVDDGAGATDPTGDGHGLVGMRERAVLVGGYVSAGARADGPGFRVHAVLPLSRATSALHDGTDVVAT